jgi:hypothetical protein
LLPTKIAEKRLIIVRGMFWRTANGKTMETV